MKGVSLRVQDSDGLDVVYEIFNNSDIDSLPVIVDNKLAGLIYRRSVI